MNMLFHHIFLLQFHIRNYCFGISRLQPSECIEYHIFIVWWDAAIKVPSNIFKFAILLSARDMISANDTPKVYDDAFKNIA